ncbi:hypothetical protein B566_EDAN013473 [Ephemera danica]|nr:hypothetical protein B566_EDAN013473 [Ephemera danica]
MKLKKTKSRYKWRLTTSAVCWDGERRKVSSKHLSSRTLWSPNMPEYECEAGYQFQNKDNYRLFCKEETWRGPRPECVRLRIDESTTEGNNLVTQSACGQDNGGCEHGCQLSNDGNVACTCHAGYKINPHDPRGCIDLNECEEHHECEGHCENTQGSYVCSCSDGLQLDTNGNCDSLPGMKLADDGRKCRDVDECHELSELYNFGCSHTCLNTPGSAFCLFL